MEGGCLCGKIRFTSSVEPKSVVNCHCNNCKRSVGAAYITWAVFQKDCISFNITPPTHTAPNRAVRTFCDTCGTSIAYWDPNRESVIDITVGCLDDPEKCPPERNIWTKKRLSWIEDPGDIPDHEDYP